MKAIKKIRYQLLIGLGFVLLFLCLTFSRAHASSMFDWEKNITYYSPNTKISFIFESTVTSQDVYLENTDTTEKTMIEVFPHEEMDDFYVGSFSINQAGNYRVYYIDSNGLVCFEPLSIAPNQFDDIAPSIEMIANYNQLTKNILINISDVSSGIAKTEYVLYDKKTDGKLIMRDNMEEFCDEIALLTSGEYYIKVQATDKADNVAFFTSPTLWYEVDDADISVKASPSTSQPATSVDVSILIESTNATFRFYELNGTVYDIGHYTNQYATLYKAEKNEEITISVKTRAADLDSNQGNYAATTLMISNIIDKAPDDEKKDPLPAPNPAPAPPANNESSSSQTNKPTVPVAAPPTNIIIPYTDNTKTATPTATNANAGHANAPMTPMLPPSLPTTSSATQSPSKATVNALTTKIYDNDISNKVLGIAKKGQSFLILDENATQYQVSFTKKSKNGEITKHVGYLNKKDVLCS